MFNRYSMQFFPADIFFNRSVLHGILLVALLHWFLHAHQQEIESTPLYLACCHLSLWCNVFSILLALASKLLALWLEKNSSFWSRLSGGPSIWCQQKGRTFWSLHSLDSIRNKYDRILRSLAYLAESILRQKEESEVLLGLPFSSNNFSLICTD